MNNDEHNTFSVSPICSWKGSMNESITGADSMMIEDLNHHSSLNTPFTQAIFLLQIFTVK